MWWKKFWNAVISRLENKSSNSFGKTETAEGDNGVRVRDARPAIRPVLPANMQARLLGGIALVMVLVIAFSGRKQVREPKASLASALPPIVEASPDRIREYRTTIDDSARKLAAEEEELVRTKQELNVRVAGGTSVPVQALVPVASGANTYSVPPDRSSRPVNPLQVEQEKRDYQSLFSSNIVISYRPPAPSISAPSGSAAWREALAATLNPPPAASLASERPTPPAKEDRPMADGYRLLEGTIIETVLTNRLDSSFSGPVNCMVTTNVYSRDHSILLIPQGSRILGEAKRVESVGDQRLAVSFHRLIRPDDYSISLDRFQGLDQIGETGLRDQVNHHYLQIFGASLAIGSIAGLAQSSTRYGTNESAADAYQQGVASSLSQSAIHILDRFLNVLPTFTIREGQRINVFLSGDLTVPAYQPNLSKGALQ